MFVPFWQFWGLNTGGPPSVRMAVCLVSETEHRSYGLIRSSKKRWMLRWLIFAPEYRFERKWFRKTLSEMFMWRVVRVLAVPSCFGHYVFCEEGTTGAWPCSLHAVIDIEFLCSKTSPSDRLVMSSCYGQSKTQSFRNLPRKAILELCPISFLMK